MKTPRRYWLVTTRHHWGRCGQFSLWEWSTTHPSYSANHWRSSLNMKLHLIMRRVSQILVLPSSPSDWTNGSKLFIIFIHRSENTNTTFSRLSTVKASIDSELKYRVTSLVWDSLVAVPAESQLPNKIDNRIYGERTKVQHIFANGKREGHKIYARPFLRAQDWGE